MKFNLKKRTKTKRLLGVYYSVEMSKESYKKVNYEMRGFESVCVKETVQL